MREHFIVLFFLSLLQVCPQGALVVAGFLFGVQERVARQPGSSSLGSGDAPRRRVALDLF